MLNSDYVKFKDMEIGKSYCQPALILDIPKVVKPVLKTC